MSVAAESTWTREEDKLFEKALVEVPEEIAGRWQWIADAVPGKTAEQVRIHYEALEHDLEEIESGRIELPNYPEDDEKSSFMNGNSEVKTGQIAFGMRKGAKHGEAERKKGTPWTEEEHRKFLEGLAKYGKGDWRSISRNSVVTRTPTQVASHAQKFFLRQASLKKERKRSSIHDITTTDTTRVVVQSQPPPPPLPTSNLIGCQGAVGIGGAPPPHMVYGYQQNFGYPV